MMKLSKSIWILSLNLLTERHPKSKSSEKGCKSTGLSMMTIFVVTDEQFLEISKNNARHNSPVQQQPPYKRTWSILLTHLFRNNRKEKGSEKDENWLR